MIKKKYRSNGIMIGADPEFILTEAGRTVSAVNYTEFNNTSSEIGCDGGRHPIEIRPPPMPITDIKRMVNNIEDIIIEISQACKDNMRIYAGASRRIRDHDCDSHYESIVPIGGHIHFGCPRFINRREDYPIKPNTELNDDFYIDRDKIAWLMDVLFLPIINFFINPKELYERTRKGYGKIGDVRYQSWGFEYRTPYSFIISPFLTKAFFALTALIVYNYKRIPLRIDLHQDIIKYYRDIKDMKKLKAIYKQIKPTIIKLIKYNSPNPEFDSYIISLFSLIENKKQCFMDMDVFKNYKIIRPKTLKNLFFSREVGMEKIKYILEKNIINKKFSKIYIYIVDSKYMYPEYRKPLEDNCIIIQRLPRIQNLPYGIKQISATSSQTKNYRRAIGLSQRLINSINNRKYNISFLIKYLNGLSKYV